MGIRRRGQRRAQRRDRLGGSLRSACAWWFGWLKQLRVGGVEGFEGGGCEGLEGLLEGGRDRRIGG